MVFINLLTRNEDECEKTFGKNSARCQKPTSDETVPIVLGVCIPLGLAFIVLCYLQYRHHRKLKKEEIDNQDIDVDMDMDEFDQHNYEQHNEKMLSQYNDDPTSLPPPGAIARPLSSSRTRSLAGSMSSSQHQAENPFYSSAPYLLHPEHASSKSTLDEYSRSINSIYDASTTAYPASVYSGPQSRAASRVNFEKPPFRAPHQLQKETTHVPTTSTTSQIINEDSASSRQSYASAQSHSYNVSTSMTPPSSANSPVEVDRKHETDSDTENENHPRPDHEQHHEAHVPIAPPSNDYIPTSYTADLNNSKAALVNNGSDPSIPDDITPRRTSSSSSDPNSMRDRHLSYRDVNGSSTQDFSFDTSDELPASFNSGPAPPAEFSFEPTREEDGDLVRSDTKHFERVKSIYREYMDEAEGDDEEDGDAKPESQTPSAPPHSSARYSWQPESAITTSIPTNHINTTNTSYDDSYESNNSRDPLHDRDRDDARIGTYESTVDRSYPNDDSYDDSYGNSYAEDSLGPFSDGTHPYSGDSHLEPHPAWEPTSRELPPGPYHGQQASVNSMNPSLSIYQESVYDRSSVYDNRSIAGDAASTYYPPPHVHGSRTGSMGSSQYSAAAPIPPMPRAAQSPAAAPIPSKPLPKLKALPNPSNLNDDDAAVLFAPKQRRKAPKQVQVPAQPAPPAVVSPTIGSISPSLPSPHAFHQKGMLANLDFAPPKKYASPADSRSNSLSSGPRSPSISQNSGATFGQSVQQHTRPPSTLVPGIDDSEMLRPQMNMR